MKKQTFTGKMTRYERLNSSYYGNPRYEGTFEDAEGNELYAKTASDSACGYSFLNEREKTRVIEYHETRTGNLIIDYITIAE